MSGKKTRKQRIQGYMTSEDCFFIGNKKKLVYHKKDCPLVEQIVNNDLISCGPNPENKGYKPCPFCKPQPVAVSKKTVDKELTKADLIRRAMAELAARRYMHIEFIGENAIVTTIAGEWYFNYNIRPIQLHHKNNVQWFDRHGQPTGFYHRQYLTFETPMEALAYIYRHERAAENRAFAPSTQQEQIPDSESTI